MKFIRVITGMFISLLFLIVTSCTPTSEIDPINDLPENEVITSESEEVVTPGSPPLTSSSDPETISSQDLQSYILFGVKTEGYESGKECISENVKKLLPNMTPFSPIAQFKQTQELWKATIAIYSELFQEGEIDFESFSDMPLGSPISSQLVSILTACAVNYDDVDMDVTYYPFVPVGIKVDDSGRITLATQVPIVTPIGVFNIGFDIEIVEGFTSDDTRHLLIYIDDEVHIYTINSNDNFGFYFDEEELSYRINSLEQIDGDLVLKIESSE